MSRALSLRVATALTVVLGYGTMVAGASAGQDASAGAFRGRVVHGLSLEPVATAILVVEETGLEVKPDSTGTFTVRGLPPGTYHLVVTAIGFTPNRVEFTVPAPDAQMRQIRLDPELHYSEVVSVSPNSRDQFEAYQPTSVLAGQDLAATIQSSLAATVTSQPGIAQRGFGPGPARPVIRGFDGDRVVVLEDGQRMGDLSSQSADHGVNVNPAVASRIEVVRGPATLLYGSSAIGGLVNVISDLIPTGPITHPSGALQFDGSTGARDGGAAADVMVGNGAWALRAGGAGRASGDVRTPESAVDNTQSVSGLGNVGVSWTRANGYLGASYQYDRFKYGIPVVEDGQVELDPRRHSLTVRGEARKMDGLISSLRGSFAYRRYRHDELVGGEPETRFKNDTSEFDLVANHRPFGRLTGTIGGWGLLRSFASEGEEALSPPVDQKNAAAFTYEELTWSHVVLQFGARFDHTGYTPELGRRPRSFDSVSGSVGVLLRPTDNTSVAVSLARAVRAPALEELYFFGPHPGNYAFEIGNPDLAAEKNLGVDAAFRWRVSRFSGEVSVFRNDIKDYVFRYPLSTEEFVERYGEDAAEGESEFPYVLFLGADAVLQGVEAHADYQVSKSLVAEASFDVVRGELKASGEDLPRIPPMRLMLGGKYQRGAFQAGADVVFAAKQDRVYREETPTDGYGLMKLYASYAFESGGVLHTLTLRLDNATNELYRNHLSYIKDLVPEMGRSLKAIYAVKF